MENEDQIRKKIQTLSILLCITAFINAFIWVELLLSAFGYPGAIIAAGEEITSPEPMYLMGIKAGIILSVVIFYGASHMYAFKRYGLSFAASILAVIPVVSPFFILSVPAGIYSVVLLRKREVQKMFEQEKEKD